MAKTTSKLCADNIYQIILTQFLYKKRPNILVYIIKDIRSYIKDYF